MKKIPSSELIINSDGSIYHLNIRPEQLANTIITVGDPDRVEKVSRHFDRVDTKVRKREFATHTGELNGERISVISTGIGTDNIDIVLTELDALVNIDFETRMVKEDLTSLRIIRVGTSGALQEDIPINSFIASAYGVGLDGLMHFYEHTNNANETMVAYEFVNYFGTKIQFPIRPYIAEAGTSLMDLYKDYSRGITVTCPGFYGPQGRVLRAQNYDTEMLPLLAEFVYRDLRVTNFEMETAGIYGMARMLGHEAISFSAILANRRTNEFSKHPVETTELLIQRVLGAL